MEVYLLGDNEDTLELPWTVFNAIIMLLVSIGEDVSNINDSDYVESLTCESYGAAILGAVQTSILKRIMIKDGNYLDGYAEYYIGPRLTPENVFSIHCATAKQLARTGKKIVDMNKIDKKVRIRPLRESNMENLNHIGNFFLSSGGVTKSLC